MWVGDVGYLHVFVSLRCSCDNIRVVEAHPANLVNAPMTVPRNCEREDRVYISEQIVTRGVYHLVDAPIPCLQVRVGEGRS